jgi:hypothetical protein
MYNIRRIIFSAVLLLTGLTTFSQVYKTVNVTAAGNLTNQLTTTEKSTVTNLTVSGHIDARDVQLMRDNMPVLAVLDLSGTTIDYYYGMTGTYYGYNYAYPANEMPPLSFYEYPSGPAKTSLVSIVLPSGLTSVGYAAFNLCSGLTGTLTLPSGLIYIGEFAFNVCSELTGTLTLPLGLTYIGIGAFQGCSKLTSVSFPSSLISIGEGAFNFCTGLTGALSLPSSLTSIGRAAFQSCSGLTSVSFPSGLTSIGYFAFNLCSELTGALTLPPGLITIGDTAFQGCSKLTSVSFPLGLTSIGNFAFNQCSGLTNVSFPLGLTSIGDGAFYSCSNLTEITNFNPVPITINSNVFAGVNTSTCSLKVSTDSRPLYLNAAVWKDFSPITPSGIAVSAQANNPLWGSVSLANQFYTSGTTVNVTATPVSGMNFIHWTSKGTILSTNPVLSLTLTQDTALIAHFGKSASLNLTAGTLKTNLANATTVTHLTLTGTIDARDVKFMRDSMPILAVLDISGATIVAYTGAEGPGGTYSIPYYANEMPEYSFDNPYTSGTDKPSLVSVVLPSGLISIGHYAFSFCIGLTNISLPSGLTSIERSAFSECSRLTSVDFPSGLTSIGQSAFYSCSSLTSVSLPSGLTSLGTNAFAYCSGLTTVSLPSGLTSIEYGAFYRCSGLTEITNLKSVPVSITDKDVFYGVSRSTCTLKVLATSVSSYQNAAVWKDFMIKGEYYAVSITVNNPLYGSVSGDGFHPVNGQVSVMATANTGYVFKYWTINDVVVSTANPYIFTLTSDISLVANFIPEGTFIVTITANNMLYGSVSGSGLYPTNGQVTATATANSGYVFKNWTSNGIVVSTANPYIFTVTGDIDIIATFAPEGSFIVSVSANNTSYGSVSGGGIYNANDQVTLTATANTGYAFENWTSNGVVVSTVNPFTFTIKSDTTIIATFKTTIGIAETTTQSDIVLYPNPAGDAISIVLPENTTQATFILYDIQGKQLLQQEIRKENTISVAHLSSGMYIYNIILYGKRMTGKIVKQ